MSFPDGTIALDLATRTSGWAYAAPGDSKPAYGVWTLPGMDDRGRLYASLRNCLDDAFELHRPARLILAPAIYSQAQTSARALLGMVSVAELACYDNSVAFNEIAETTARKAILGKGVFNLRDDDGKAIKGTGTPRAKQAAMDWCKARGWQPQTHDVADALVLLEYDRRWLRSRQPTRDFSRVA